MKRQGWIVGWLFLYLLLSGIWVACTPPATTCQTDADCKAGRCFAPTGETQKRCAVPLDGGGDGSTTDTSAEKTADTTPDAPAETTPDAAPDATPDGTPDAQPEATPEKPVGPEVKPETTPTSCVPTIYDPSKDPGNGGQVLSLSPLEKTFFDGLRVLFLSGDACHDKIWGGQYRLSKIPMYVVNIEGGLPATGKGVRGFLLNHPKPPASAVLIDSKSIFGLTVYLYDAQKAGVPEPGFAFDMAVGDTDVYAFEFSTGDEFFNPALPGFWGFFVHEAFHRVQLYEEAWIDAQGSQDDLLYPLDADNIALSYLEGRVLVDGLKNPGKDEATLKAFLAIRNLRIKQDKSPEKMVKLLDGLQEWLEGTAQYIEERFMAVAGQPYTPGDFSSTIGRLTVIEFVEPAGGKGLLRDSLLSRFYATGAAMGTLLDRVGDPGWKEACKKGTTPIEYLQARYKTLSETEQQTLIDDAKKKFNYTELDALGKKYAAFP